MSFPDYSTFDMSDYRCTQPNCGAVGVKLWRAIHSDDEAWCSRCATRQAGLPDDIDDTGRRNGEYGPSDQVYSATEGQNLLPYVPLSDGSGTWGYSSVPDTGVAWWKSLPTRLSS